MPFLQAASAAGGGGVLSYEDGVIFCRCLFAVVGRVGGGQTGFDEVAGMVEYSGQAFLVEISGFLAPQSEAAPERRTPQGLEQFIHIAHLVIIADGPVAA